MDDKDSPLDSTNISPRQRAYRASLFLRGAPPPGNTKRIEMPYTLLIDAEKTFKTVSKMGTLAHRLSWLPRLADIHGFSPALTLSFAQKWVGETEKAYQRLRREMTTFHQTAARFVSRRLSAGTGIPTFRDTYSGLLTAESLFPKVTYPSVETLTDTLMVLHTGPILMPLNPRSRPPYALYAIQPMIIRISLYKESPPKYTLRLYQCTDPHWEDYFQEGDPRLDKSLYKQVAAEGYPHPHFAHSTHCLGDFQGRMKRARKSRLLEIVILLLNATLWTKGTNPYVPFKNWPLFDECLCGSGKPITSYSKGDTYCDDCTTIAKKETSKPKKQKAERETQKE